MQVGDQSAFGPARAEEQPRCRLRKTMRLTLRIVGHTHTVAPFDPCGKIGPNYVRCTTKLLNQIYKLIRPWSLQTPRGYATFVDAVGALVD